MGFWKICPHDPKHMVPNYRFQLHLLICPKRLTIQNEEEFKDKNDSYDSDESYESVSSDHTVDEKIRLLSNDDQNQNLNHDNLKLLTMAEYVNISKLRRIWYRNSLRNYLSSRLTNGNIEKNVCKIE
ncbi:hypothetical protein DERP_002372 [Dermatophagoides pteronyssinus]|uniref:CHHC U11-48K-type domain-containing protein n=1 Tax=Dermatophagoides pteronyssinus TaxID=6956 RepID=A0ABQ8JI69_DERPT|nr:hypothetical protein DERP_002372 [Dermatophagoides pteronyssinus]